MLFSGAIYPADDTLLSIPIKLILVAACVSLAGGITQTLQRLNNDSQQEIKTIKNIYLDVLTGLFTSLSGGMLMFAFLEGSAMRPMYQGALIFLAGWGGSKTLDYAYNKYVIREP